MGPHETEKILEQSQSAKQRILKRRISTGQETIEEMLRIISHHGITNENHSEILFIAYQDG
ncbi:hypothetical protein T10_9248 [Trichinella papuae]|uniref:Uncharacterized protein n=1 Tax=Trichinella papuae TaxID=268474 RepID=A0A0V1LXG4_9BILA|nr:hypothetical protein T10_9248 [Trichinella papuae]